MADENKVEKPKAPRKNGGKRRKYQEELQVIRNYIETSLEIYGRIGANADRVEVYKEVLAKMDNGGSK